MGGAAALGALLGGGAVVLVLTLASAVSKVAVAYGLAWKAAAGVSAVEGGIASAGAVASRSACKRQWVESVEEERQRLHGVEEAHAVQMAGMQAVHEELTRQMQALG